MDFYELAESSSLHLLFRFDSIFLLLAVSCLFVFGDGRVVTQPAIR